MLRNRLLSYSRAFSLSFYRACVLLTKVIGSRLLPVAENPNMSNMLKCGIRFLNIKQIKLVVPHLLLPAKNQRLCLHTSWILNVNGKELFMPALSPTMEQGTIVKWLKKEGEVINPGDIVVDIQTDKAVMGLEIEDESILAKIIVVEGQNANVGELIGLTVEVDEDWKSVEVPKSKTKIPDTSSAKSLKQDTPPPPKKAESVPDGQTNIFMPSLSPTMDNGTVVKWLKQEGDNIEPGDVIAEIQTDKAVVAFELEEELILAKILVSEGVSVNVGHPIAIAVQHDFDTSKIVIPTAPAPKAAGSATTVTQSKTSTKDESRKSNQVYGLAVKRLLQEYGLSSGSIKGTGRPNRILKEDVLAHIQNKNMKKVPQNLGPTKPTAKPPQSQAIPPTQSSGYTDTPVSNMRAVIAKRLIASKSTIPHSYASIDININKIEVLRKKLKAANNKLSINDFVIKAVAHALEECPEINSLYENGQVISKDNVDISIAVSTPTGLITPIIFNAANKALEEISNDVKTLSNKAREGKLQPKEFEGGTFTISNLGMFGISNFCAIINPPQTAILAVGTGRKIFDSCKNINTMMNITLSYNRSVIDEEQAANFLILVETVLKNPSILMIGRNSAKKKN